MQMKKDEFKYIGKRVIREDSADKVRGRYDYLADSAAGHAGRHPASQHAGQRAHKGDRYRGGGKDRGRGGPDIQRRAGQ